MKLLYETISRKGDQSTSCLSMPRDIRLKMVLLYYNHPYAKLHSICLVALGKAKNDCDDTKQNLGSRLRRHDRDDEILPLECPRSWLLA